MVVLAVVDLGRIRINARIAIVAIAWNAVAVAAYRKTARRRLNRLGGSPNPVRDRVISMPALGPKQILELTTKPPHSGGVY